MHYGTSGFRDHHSKIESISIQIGIAMTLLSIRENRSFGIMITASHNHYDDNGVKIMDHKGDMVTLEIEKYLEHMVNQDQCEYTNVLLDTDKDNYNCIHIGYDSRISSPIICDLIVQGIQSIYVDFPIKLHGYVTTPELHYTFSKMEKNISYLDYIKRASKLINMNCILDCANGIGSKIMRLVSNPCIHLINTEWSEPTKLNVLCSSDYVCTTRILPRLEGLNNIYVQDNLCASLDGDADRIVFYYRNSDRIIILNGDYIAALVLTYLSKQLSNCVQEITIGFIYTGYTNNACLEYVKSLHFPSNVTVSFICTSTGVKHLHKEAIKYDVGVYFEQNGHGNVLFRNILVDELQIISQLFHPVIGDGVADLFSTLYILQELNWNVQDWSNIYTEYPSKLGKCPILDKGIFKSSSNELELIEPLYLQSYINHLYVDHVIVRAFVRASGTENVVRIYVESHDQDTSNSVYCKIAQFIEDHVNIKPLVISNCNFIVRPIRYTDATQSYYNLLGQLTRIDPDLMDYEQTKSFIQNLGINSLQNHQIYVIEDINLGKIVASGTIFVEEKLIRNYGKVGHIEDIVVDSTYRGFGLGKLMIDHLTNLGTKLGCYKCILDCDDINLGFYEKCGYIRKGSQMSNYV